MLVHITNWDSQRGTEVLESLDDPKDAELAARLQYWRDKKGEDFIETFAVNP